MISKIIISTSIICILYISIQNTVKSILHEEDMVELTESPEEEKEIEKEIEFISCYFNNIFQDKLAILISHNVNHYIINYNSPIKSVLTPPPNYIV